MLSTPFSMHVFQFRFIDTHVLDFRFTIDSLSFIYVTDHCMHLYAWTISLDHVHVWLSEHTNWLHLTYSLGYFLITLDLCVQIFRVWTLLLPASPWSAREILILLLVSTFPYFILYILLLRFLVILCSWFIVICFVITVYLCFIIVRMYVTTVLSYSDSYLYWCLAYM